LLGAIQLFYVFYFYARFAYRRSKPSTDNPQYPPISVIIAARNESDNLYEHLPSILSQDYPNYEVIVVNNQSIDDSNWILTAFAQQFPQLKVVEISRSPQKTTHHARYQSGYTRFFCTDRRRLSATEQPMAQAHDQRRIRTKAICDWLQPFYQIQRLFE
jgi:cellulose synthase/poly-beta-1,6-N-acetylglucosamine synthase-like glycosyltransferase